MLSLARRQFNRADLAQQFERRIAINPGQGDNLRARLPMSGYSKFVASMNHRTDESAWLTL
jgi:hypothetical protein